MHYDVSSQLIARASGHSATDLVRREARRLHRSAASASLSIALPVLRRLIAAGIFPGNSLKDLFHGREAIRRKHTLRLLARESGFDSWESFSPTLIGLDPRAVDRFRIDECGNAFLNLWFPNEPAAQTFAAANGGRVLRIGAHAVVLPAARNGSVEQANEK